MKRRIFIGNYENEERQIVEKLLRMDDRVLELGSGLGYISTICARKLGDDRVVTVEANPEMEKAIRRSFELNGVSPKLLIGAVGPEAGVVEFFFEANFWSSSSLPTGKSTKSQKVKVLPIAELMGQHRPTVLICDIEGGEYALFPALPLDGVRLIVAELHPNRLGIDACSDLVALIMGQGFCIDVANTTVGTVTFQRRAPVSRTLPEPGFVTRAKGEGVLSASAADSPRCPVNQMLTVPKIETQIIIRRADLVGLRRVIASLCKLARMFWPRGRLRVPFSAASDGNSDRRLNRQLRESL